ncbi:MAG: hypothetical protein P4L76_04025 [Beijerinckiaceae bacterium]|nr:hypothetical protein [Beijerinckiaceae bacterium]
MTAKRAAILCPREPVGLRLEGSAAYLSMSPSLFMRLVDEGLMPAPRQAKGALIWDADELLAAFRLLPRKKLDLPPGVPPLHDDGLAGEKDWSFKV